MIISSNQLHEIHLVLSLTHTLATLRRANFTPLSTLTIVKVALSLGFGVQPIVIANLDYLRNYGLRLRPDTPRRLRPNALVHHESALCRPMLLTIHKQWALNRILAATLDHTIDTLSFSTHGLESTYINRDRLLLLQSILGQLG